MSDTEGKPDLKAVKAEIREGVDDLTGNLQKAASSLLVAHGGAMLACLSQLKDYSSNANLKHIGFVIAAFGVGFLLAMLSYIDVAVGRSKLMLGIYKADARAFQPMPLMRAVTFLYFSAGVLGLAVLGIVWRFFWF